MITKIEVDGFKSLIKFDLKLNKGLNILVGPNGAGKTNIILFFEFLSNIVSNQIGSAISHVGGAGSIFQKIGKEKYVDTISSKIYGCIKTMAKAYIVYEYQFEIRISFQKDNVYFSRQEIKIRTATKFLEDPDKVDFKEKWDLDICYTKPEDEKPEILINSYDNKRVRSRFIRFDKPKKVEAEVKDFILNQNPTYHSIIPCLFPIADFSRPILSDLKGGETFNIIPSKVRELEDSASPPGIRKDGSGLATTLYAMKKSKSQSGERHIRLFLGFDEPQNTYNPKTLDRIIQFLKAANSTINHLDVDNDPFNNTLLVKIKIKTGNYEAILPLSSMSDGTIKWLTLITAILTSRTIFSIEEPENFLHPWMQAEIAKIMRNHLQEKKSHAFVLMTTHSESLINHARPEEIIIVDLTEGGTKARRISNISAIKDEISHTGFGLGYFYFSNSLSDE